jgi:hypothetical protein
VYSLIEFIDEVRDVLVQTYGAEIRCMLQDATTREADASDDDAPF